MHNPNITERLITINIKSRKLNFVMYNLFDPIKRTGIQQVHYSN